MYNSLLNNSRKHIKLNTVTVQSQPTPRAPRRMREAQEGNVLWQWYYQLSRQGQIDLVNEVIAAGWAKTTFLTDTYKDRSLAKMPFERLTLYANWFNAHAPQIGQDLRDVIAGATAPKAAA